MNNETLLRVKQADPWPEDRPTPEGVWHAWQALDEIVQRTTQPPGKPTRLIGSGPVVAIVAAAVVLVLIGGLALLINNSDETQPADTVVTTTPGDLVLPTAGGVLGPGSWSVAATFPGVSLSPDQVAEMVKQVMTWPGVLDVSGVPDQAAWRQFTGIVADCDDGEVLPPCRPGVVVLATTPWMARVAERLETEFGMEAITSFDVERAFVQGYIDAALERTSPAVLEFDPSAFGTEQSLTGPVTEVDGEVCDTCDVVVGTEVDGYVVVAGLEFMSDSLGIDVPGGGGGFSDGYVVVAGIEFGTFAASEFMVDGFGRGGAIAVLNGFTELDAVIGPRRIYALAGLPLDAAVVTFELVDGTRVWQHPVGGMALFVDKVGSMPAGFVDYYDQGGAVDPDELEELSLANPLVVLDREGVAIMRIEDAGHGRSLVTDLRFDPDAISKSREVPFFVPDAASSLVGKLAYTSSEGIMILDLDRGFTSQLTDGPGLDFSPSLSPDGTRIAFVSDRDASNFPEAAAMHGAYVYDIYVMDADGSNVVRLTDTGGFDMNPGWSPDGTRIVFASERSGNGEIYVMDPDGSDVVNLTNLAGAGGGGSPTWSPDGTRILFATDGDLYLMDADGSNVIQLTHSAEVEQDPAWSPDGARIAFFQWGPSVQGLPELYVMGADGSNIVRIDSDPVAGASQPAWSPDGQFIAYVRGLADPAPGVFQIHVMDVDGSNVIQITNLPAREPTWSR